MILLTELDEKYSSLVKDRRDIDFIGVNIAPFELKVYQRCEADDEITCALQARDMLHNIESVLSSEHDTYRTDIAIKARTDVNMEYLFDVLRGRAEFFAFREAFIRNIAALKVTDAEGYQFMSLYHIGFAERHGTIAALKFYFRLMWCVNPDIKHEKFEYMDSYFIDSIRRILAPEYEELLHIAEKILSQSPKHLWMLGSDLTSSGVEKVKIYIRNTNPSENIYGLLAGVLSENLRMCMIPEELRTIEEWNLRHKKLRCEGFALGMTPDHEYSLNLYY